MSHVSSFGSVGFVLVCINLPTWTSHTMIPSPKLQWSDNPTSVHEIDSDDNHSAQNETGYKCTSHPIPSKNWNSTAITPAPQFLARKSLARVRNSAAITPAPRPLARYRNSVLVRRHRIVLTQSSVQKEAPKTIAYQDPSCL